MTAAAIVRRHLHCPYPNSCPHSIRVGRQVADLLARVLWDAAKARDNSAESLDAFSRLLFLPAALLTDPKTSGTSSRAVWTASIVNIFRERLTLWNNGQFQTLWTTAQQSSTARSLQATAKDQLQINAKRAVRLAKEGAYEKAALALQSDGLAGSSAEASDALLKKHPQRTPSDDGNQYTTQNPLPQVTALTPEQIWRPQIPTCIRGWRFRSASQPPRRATWRTEHERRHRAARWTDKGRQPPGIRTWTESCGSMAVRCTARRISQAGRRPIAVGESLRRLLSSCLLHRISKEAREFFHTLQLGIATPAGIEAVVYSVGRVAHKFGENGNYAMLSVDLKNAFNLVKPTFGQVESEPD